MDGVLTCARYAFAPNHYKYCGPDANRTIASYLSEGVADPGLSAYLSEFAVLFPYLRLIAQENGIADPFDPRVVEAYWIGNGLLEHIGMNAFAEHLRYGQRLQSRLSPKKMKWIIEKVPKGAKLHHSFHVFSIFIRTGHHAVEHTLDTMDNCRISWGKIIQDSHHTFREFPQTASPAVSEIGNFGGQARFKIQDSRIRINTQQLVYRNGKLGLREGVVREVSLPVDGQYSKQFQPGDLVTIHWGFICEKIDETMARSLERYTKHNLRLANETI